MACVIVNEVLLVFISLMKQYIFQSQLHSIDKWAQFLGGSVVVLIITVLLQNDFEVSFMFTARRYSSFSLYKTPKVSVEVKFRKGIFKFRSRK